MVKPGAMGLRKVFRETTHVAHNFILHRQSVQLHDAGKTATRSGADLSRHYDFFCVPADAENVSRRNKVDALPGYIKRLINLDDIRFLQTVHSRQLIGSETVLLGNTKKRIALFDGHTHTICAR